MTGPRGAPARILVAYASGFGSTAEVARAIGDALSSANARVDVASVADIEDVTPYDAVIVGSPIRYDKWMPEATGFVERFASDLKDRPVALFFTCLALSREDDRSARQARSYADRLREGISGVRPLDVAGFAGVLDYSRFPVLVRPFARFLFSFLRVREGDYRNWDAIGEWAGSLKQNPEWPS